MTILVQQLRAEIDQLRSQLEMAKKHREVLQQIGNALRLGAGSDLHTACVPEIVALRRDAERYRWLRRLDRPHGEMRNPGEIGWPSVCVAPGEAHGLCLDRMDAAIDQAMTKEGL